MVPTAHCRDLGVDRGTVSKIFKRLNAPEDSSVTPIKPKRPAVSNSACQPLHDLIQVKLDQGLSAERIFYDLRQEVGFEHSYQSVKRYGRKLKATSPKRVWRMECAPGEEAQIDFGFTKTLLDQDGKQRMSNILRVTLSHSRKGYTETLPAQNTDHFLAAIENAFRHFGGVPATLRIDNLKAAVKQADGYEPELHPKILAFAEHYQTTIIPTRPYTPELSKAISSLTLHHRMLTYVTGNRPSPINASTAPPNNMSLQQFRNAEKPALRPLPSEASHNFQEAQRTVHLDSYVELARSYYEVPPNTLATKSGSGGTPAWCVSTTPTSNPSFVI